jgi:hypothetical protein
MFKYGKSVEFSCEVGCDIMVVDKNVNLTG